MILVASAILLLTGCSFSGKGTDRTLPAPENSVSEEAALPLRVVVSVPDRVQAGQVFKLSGQLWNDSDDTLELNHGAAMITYTIYDEDGEPVTEEPGMRAVADIGYHVSLLPRKSYSFNEGDHVSPPLNKRTLQKAGSYMVVGTAELQVGRNGKWSTQKFESEPVSFVAGGAAGEK